MPIAGWHACRVRPPDEFQAGSFRTVKREHEGKEYRVIIGRLKGESTTTEQAYRYDMAIWSATAARAHCREHDGTFEKGVKPEDATSPDARPTDRAAPCACQDPIAAVIAEGQSRQPPAGFASDRRAELRAEAGADDALEIHIYDRIGGWFGISAASIIEALRAAPDRPVRLHLNSPGGDVFDGLAIYNTLRQHAAPVEVWIEGLAASIASVVAMAGREIVMAEASFLMIHEPHAVTIGTAHDHRAMARLLDKTAGVLADVYARRTRGDRDQIRAWMHDETWFTASDAEAAGFVTAITAEPLPAEALAARSRFDLSAFRSSPLGATAPSSPPPTPERREAAARWYGHQARLAAFAARKEIAR
jgi:ATP-dependent protease ClpP protease subunit